MLKRLLLVLAMALLLAGCGSKASTYYLLRDDAAPLNVSSLPGTTLAVSSVNIPDYLDRSGVVIREAGGSVLDVPLFNIWAEPVDTGVRRVISARMAAPLLARGVTVLSSQSGHTTPSYAVVVDIARMDADTDGLVTLEARWTIQDSSAQEILGSGGFAGRETIDMPAFGSKAMFDAVVLAHSRLTQQLGDTLAERACALVPAARR